MTVTTLPTTDTLTETKKARLRHIVEKNPDGSWKDQALCGYLWDMVVVKPNGTLCEDCEKIYLEKVGPS